MTHDISPDTPPFDAALASAPSRAAASEALTLGMQRAGLLESPAPPAALRWIDTFLAAYGPSLATVADAIPVVAELREEATVVPALALEKLRNRQVLFYLDTIAQYVDDQAELRGLLVEHDLTEIASEFGLSPSDALWAARVALTGKESGPSLDLLFPLLGHDRIMMRVGAISSHLLHGRGLEPIAYGRDGEPFHTIEGAKPQ